MADSSDLFWEFAARIYEPPLSLLRDNGSVRDLSNPVAVLMLVVDFETEVTMNGIANFIGNFTGVYANETVDAIRKIGCPTHAEKLARILQIAKDAGMTHAAIQRDRQGSQSFAVASFAETHGDKWDAATAAIADVESEFDYDSLMRYAEEYLGQHLALFEGVLQATQNNDKPDVE